MKKHIGSTIALVLGGLQLLGGLAKPGTAIISGTIIILGALAYRSAKKRKLGECNSSNLRKGLEIFSIVIIVLSILLQNNLADNLYNDPVPNLLIPLWIIIAYILMVLRIRKKEENKEIITIKQ